MKNLTKGVSDWHNIVNQNFEEVSASLSEKANQSDVAQLSNPSLIINDCFQVWQRGTSFTNVTSQYTADRWHIASSTGKNISQSINGMLIQAVNTETVGNNSRVNYFLEVPKYLQGKKVTLSFGFIPTVSNKKIGLQISKTSPSGDSVLLQELTLENANTLNIKSVTFIMPSVDILYIGFALSCIASATPTATYLGLTSETIFTNITFNFVKLELGSIATPFVPRLYAEELALCQRYYEKGTSIYVGTVGNADHAQGNLGFKMTKRVAPTMVIKANVTASINTIAVTQSQIPINITSLNVDENGFVHVSNTGAFSSYLKEYWWCYWEADSEIR